MYYILYIFILLCCIPSLLAQNIRKPLDFDILLSGNFGELRSNHFHSGIDFKTQGTEGKPVHAVQEGYVSRIVVSPGGYGNGLYLTHPDGTTTVYAHLQRFIPEIAAYVKEQQYQAERFAVDLTLDPEQFPVQQGGLIAYSGNTGSSGGPHLHFEVRDTRTEEVIDPIKDLKGQITDTRPPKIQALLFCPQEGKGMVGGSNRKKEQKVTLDKNGRPNLLNPIEAWGEIGMAVKAYDYMDRTSNIYGIKEIILLFEKDTIFSSLIDRFSFDETRYLNSFTDFAEWKEQRSFFMRSFVEPGNRLRFIKSKKRGIIQIDEERRYRLEYILKDAFGNTTRLPFSIIGKKQEIRQPDLENTEPFYRINDNRFGAKGIRLFIPAGNLYDDLQFTYTFQADSNGMPIRHTLHNHPVAFHRSARLSLRLPTDTLHEKRCYGIVQIQNNKRFWIGGTYRDGWLDADIREMGTYGCAQDTEAPKIIPILTKGKKQTHAFVFRLTDNLSGVEQYRGEIDGQYALFEMDNRSVITYVPDPSRLKPGTHQLRLTVSDAAGNQQVHEETFVF